MDFVSVDMKQIFAKLDLSLIISTCCRSFHMIFSIEMIYCMVFGLEIYTMARSMKLKAITNVILVLLIIETASAQDFGGVPSSIKWRQTENRTVRVIHPKGLSQTAANIAALSTYLDSNTHQSIGHKSKKIDIILQPFTSISNGYVALSPWKSEFYLTPLQNALTLGSKDWNTLLTVHEFRHVQQYSNFNHGISKWLYFLFGQDGQALANSAAIPNWFFEGDAVYQETGITGLGRGRLPDFYAPFRSIWEGERNFSYMKLRNGSFKHLTPDHYTLGYLLVSYGNRQYGNEFWKKVTYDASGYKNLFYPFQMAVKKYSGIKFKAFVSKALEDFKKELPASQSNLFQQLSANSERYTQNISFPEIIGEDSVLYVKSTGKHVPAWYLLHKGKETKITTRDIGIDDQYSYQKGLIVYTYYKPDIRWGMRNFNELAILDINSGKRILLNNSQRLFSPDLSSDTSMIVAVKIHEDASSSLQIMDLKGNILNSFTSKGLLHSYPKFSKDGKAVFSCVRDSAGNMNILQSNLSNNESRFLLPWSSHPISFTKVEGDSIFFTSAYNGIDRLLCWDDYSKVLFEVVSKYTGVQQADYHKGELVFNSTNAWGVHLYKTKGLWKQIPLDEYVQAPIDMYGLSFPKYDFTNLSYKQDTGLTSKPFSKTTRFINIHSWRPIWEQPDWSFHLYGNNVLNTFISEYYYQFNSNERFHKIGTDFAFAGLYPWITGGGSYTIGRNLSNPNGQVKWDEVNLNAGLRLPLTLTKGRMYSGLNLQSTYNLNAIIAKQSTLDFFKSSNFPFLENAVSFFARSQKALQQINSRIGTSFFIRHRVGVVNSGVNQLLLSANLLLPGLLRNHSLVLSGAIQSRDTLNFYRFTNSFPFSRGYESLNFPRMWKGSLNYHLPLLYPDWGFAQILFIQRIRANLFFDQSMVKSLRSGRTLKVRSIGTEMYFDTKIWNQQNLTFGIRYSRLLDGNIYIQQPNPNQWQFILPLDVITR